MKFILQNLTRDEKINIIIEQIEFLKVQKNICLEYSDKINAAWHSNEILNLEKELKNLKKSI